MEAGKVRKEAPTELATDADPIRWERWPHRLSASARQEKEPHTLVGPGGCLPERGVRPDLWQGAGGPSRCRGALEVPGMIAPAASRVYGFDRPASSSEP
jgi:hypothetical protein